MPSHFLHPTGIRGTCEMCGAASVALTRNDRADSDWCRACVEEYLPLYRASEVAPLLWPPMAVTEADVEDFERFITETS